MNYLMPHSPKKDISLNEYGLLSNLNFVLKDMCDVKNLKTSCGNPDFFKKCDFANDYAPFLKDLLNEGPVLKGITVCDEFFYSLIGENGHYGTPTNLNAPSCVPGGSSSGSAAALTTDLYDFSIGSDTGGSVRIPASFCGLIGMRPTHNRINTKGVYPMAPSFDTIGWFANNPEIFQKVGNVLLNNIERSNVDFKQYVVAEDLLELCDAEVQDNFNNYINVNIPNINKTRLSTNTKAIIADNFRILQGAEVKENIIPWIENNKPNISPEIRSRIDMASKITDIEVNRALIFRKTLIDEIKKSLPEGTIAVFPTSPFSAPKSGQDDESLGSFRKRLMELTSIAGMTSRPQITIPRLKDKSGPVGISLLGWKYSDEILLNKLTEI
jgi:amidase